MSQPLPRFAERLARVTRALRLLALHPDGLPVSQLAAELGAPPQQLRADLLAFYAADVGPAELGGVLRSPVLEFVGAGGEEADPDVAEVVRVLDERPTSELGMAHLSAAELAQVYSAGRELLTLEPTNTDLADALAALERTALEGVTGAAGSWQGAAVDRAALLRAAARDRRRVRIRYARAWRPGVAERVVEPYRVVGTRRGWEVDAGPPDAASAIRTYLLAGIEAADVLDEGFVPPPDVDALIAANRRERVVRLVLPQDGSWAAARYAERVEVEQQDEESVQLRVHVLPPVAQRVGLIVLAAGPGGFVVDPPDLREADRDVARELLAHHRDP